MAGSQSGTPINPNHPKQDQKTGLGLLHLITGNGKGKTTAALGLAGRAVGCGLRVCVLQFLKGAPNCGEHRFAKEHRKYEILQPNTIGSHFARKEDERTHLAQQAFLEAEKLVQSREWDLLIFDEALGAVAKGYLEEARMLTLLRERPVGLEVVLTGRGATPALIELADYVSEIKLVKHPFEQHITARRGIEF